MSKRYFNYTDPSDPGSGNMFGPGLYAAVDPVATRNYGGAGTDWVLVQIQLPVGFAMFDLNRDGGDTPPASGPMIDALQKADCPTSWDYDGGMLNNLFNPSTHKNPTCTATIEHILRDKLQVDGFFYSYSYSNFKACQPPLDPNSNSTTPDASYRGGAFVITDGSKFTAQSVRIFNQNTSDDLQDRMDIESSFYEADQENLNGNGLTPPTVTPQMLYAQYPQYQGWTIQSVYMGCSSTCPPYIPTASISGLAPAAPPVAGQPAAAPVTQYATVTITLPPPPVLTTMSAANPPRSGCGYGAVSCPLLWKDLDGKPFDPNLSTYMKTNYYSCSGKPDYL
jgi:hypothetical protein